MSDNWQNGWDLPSDPTFYDEFWAQPWAQPLAGQPTLSSSSYPIIGHGEGAEVGNITHIFAPPQEPITGRFPCSYPSCTKDFKRSSDRFRHIASTHQRGSTPQTTILCPITGCRRSRGRGLSRPDKLTEHLKKIHNIVRSTQSQDRGAVSVAGNNNDNAEYAQGPGAASMTDNVIAAVPVTNFGTSSNIYNGQVQGGIDAEYSYGMNPAGVTEDFASANAVDIASIAGIDQLRGGVDVGIIGYSDAFDVANFNIEEPQGASNVGMASAINSIGNVDIGQLPSDVDAGLDASLADMEWADALAAGMPAQWSADWIDEWSDEIV